ncbi:phage integrase N-terminal SAM-like domain-containing protein [Neomoorella thermoacetica]|uniref:phage integrase N-terminal SAM-like domain-containing protein n=1 Tax=Neomoorella thermoacetica TaxID=1525 RepID=UPI0008FB920C|nr:phage integrase N-terminal SAM-like domain-containing protein [Moorella thermoacetica]APC09056.1 tyrosine recombinase XerC [Moorella thermoacetica]OIQ54997.1 tyrosine recombinase XerC [Moorella thermoacetica]
MTGIERNLLVQFEKICKHIRQNSFDTRKRYRWIFIQFLRFVAVTFHLQNIKNLQEKHVIAYIQKLQKENKAKSTILTNLSVIRFYFTKIGVPEIAPNQEIFTMSKTLTKK